LERRRHSLLFDAGVTEDERWNFTFALFRMGGLRQNLTTTSKSATPSKLNGPLGGFLLRRKNDDPMLCVATGTGLAPSFPIVRGALESGMKNRISCGILAPALKEDLYGLDYLDRLASEYKNFQYKVALGPHKT